MDKTEFSRELRYTLLNATVIAIAFFNLGQLFQSTFQPKPIVVKLELPVDVGVGEIRERPPSSANSLHAALPKSPRGEP